MLNERLIMIDLGVKYLWMASYVSIFWGRWQLSLAVSIFLPLVIAVIRAMHGRIAKGLHDITTCYVSRERSPAIPPRAKKERRSSRWCSLWLLFSDATVSCIFASDQAASDPSELASRDSGTWHQFAQPPSPKTCNPRFTTSNMTRASPNIFILLFFSGAFLIRPLFCVFQPSQFYLQ